MITAEDNTVLIVSQSFLTRVHLELDMGSVRKE